MPSPVFVVPLALALLLAVVPPVGAQAPTGQHGGAHGGAPSTAMSAPSVAGTGVVDAIDVDARLVTLTHEPIAALGWPAMTMDLQAADGVDLTTIGSGDRVDFTLDRGGDGIYIITSIGRGE